jgi:membrane-associated phospholipid phosphatase
MEAGTPSGVSLRVRPGTNTVMHPATHVPTASGRTAALRLQRADDVPVLEAHRPSLAARIGDAYADRRPAVLYAVALVLGYLVAAGLTIGLGFLLVDALVPVHAIGHSDEAVNTWLAGHRTGTRNSLSDIGSMIGDVPVLPVIVALVVIASAATRHWRVAGFVLGAILVEVGTYRVASLIVHRHRPTVHRLDHLPVMESFPSGHVAASVAVYGSLAIVATSIARRGAVTIVAWSLAVLLVCIVGLSRMYRGMHHPLDVTSGVIVGILSLVVALLATRAADEVARRRAEREASA